MPFTKEQIPLLIKYSGRYEKLCRCLEKINFAFSQNKIYNQEYIEINRSFSNSIFDVWCHYVGDIYHQSGTIPEDVLNIYDLSCPSSLQSIFALKKRLDKCKSNHPLLDAMRDLVTETLPIAEAMRDLKPHILKGRKPSPNPKPENTDKIIRTCPCCLRKIAIDIHGYMVNHGYQRPGNGFITDNCAGIRFKPLEVSPDGIDFMITNFKFNLKVIEKGLSQKDYWDKLPFRENNKNTIITNDHPKWEKAKQLQISTFESEIRFIARELSTYEKLRQDWTQKETEIKRKRIATKV